MGLFLTLNLYLRHFVEKIRILLWIKCTTRIQFPQTYYEIRYKSNIYKNRGKDMIAIASIRNILRVLQAAVALISAADKPIF